MYRCVVRRTFCSFCMYLLAKLGRSVESMCKDRAGSVTVGAVI